MPIFQCRHSTGRNNFGDDVNAWLWPRLIPRLLDADDDTVLIGIGTLLNDRTAARFPHARKRVFGSGVGYGATAPHLDARWHVYCVRGPLSARALGWP